ncbi:MAG: hypothetical protein ABIA63_12960 [bacterium]
MIRKEITGGESSIRDKKGNLARLEIGQAGFNNPQNRSSGNMGGIQ